MLKRFALKRWIISIAAGIGWWVAVGTVIVGAIVFVARKQHNAAEKYEGDREARCASTSLIPAQQDGCKHERDDAYSYLPWRYELFTWPEGIEVWALIATGFVIAWQSNETRKAANASRRSLEVQEAEFAQWLDIGEWVIKYDREAQFNWSGHSVFNAPDELKVKLSFLLLNSTTRPLFIKSVRTSLAIGTEKVFKTFSTEESTPVPPKDQYRVVIDTTLNKAQVIEYIGYTLPIVAVVQVNFDNALKKPEYAGFERLVLCNVRDGTTTESKGHIAKET